MQHTAKSDLVIVIGTSMRVSPACNIPSLSYLKGGKFVLINLQKCTPDKEKHVNLRVHSKCDDFMALVAKELNLQVPEFKQDEVVQELISLVDNLTVDPKF